MAIIVKKSLILVEASKIRFKGRDGKMVEKYKYIFLEEDGNLLEGFLDGGDYVNDVQDVVDGEFEKSKAKTYRFAKRLFQGETKHVLLPRDQK